jgi:tetratricopeptide (TPR) repeat protein
MFRKNYFTFLLAAALFLVGGVAAFGQTAPVSGKVMVKKGDVLVPVAGALIEVYRTGSKSKLPSDKTDKKGNFAFAGLPLGEKYILAISGPGISPIVYPGVPAGVDNINITVSEGDGKQFTAEEVRQAVAGATKTTTNNTNGATNTSNTSNTTTPSTDKEKPAELTEEQKKLQAEEQKKIAEITASNKNKEQKNAIFQSALKEGIDAFTAKNYDLAIAKFEEGYQADTQYIGSAPAFLNSKGKALSLRGVDKYTKNNKLTDATAKMAAMDSVAKDFGDAAEAFSASWAILKNPSGAAIADPKNYEINKTDALNGIKNVVGYMIATERVDNTKLGVIKSMLQDYMSTEKDAAAKLKAQISLADVYRLASDSDNAIIEYRKALEMSPDNVDVLAGLGLSLFNSGEIANNTTQKQEGLNYMQRFIELAPNDHKYKADIVGLIDYLKQQKLTPQKTTTTKKKN